MSTDSRTSNPTTQVSWFSVEGIHRLFESTAEASGPGELTPQEFHEHAQLTSENAGVLDGSFRRYADRRRLGKQIRWMTLELRRRGVRNAWVLADRDGMGAGLVYAARLQVSLDQIQQEIEEELTKRGFKKGRELPPEMRRQYVIRACRAFWGAMLELKPDVADEYERYVEPDACQTAYFECGDTNTHMLLYADNVRLPEAMEGASWIPSLPGGADRKSRSDVIRIQPNPADSKGGTFGAREGISGGAWRVNISYGVTKLVLYCSFRVPPPEHMKCEALSAASSILTAWARKQDLALPGDTDERWSFTGNSIRKFVESVEAWGASDTLAAGSSLPGEHHWVRLLEQAIRDSIGIDPEPHCHVHPVICLNSANGSSGPQHAVQFRRAEGGEYMCGDESLGDKPRPFVVPQESTQSGKPGELVFAERSLSAQCVLWKAPLYINDMDVVPESEEGKRLRELDVTYMERAMASDLAVAGAARKVTRKRQVRSQVVHPVFMNEIPTAVVSIQHRNAGGIQRKHVRRLGILTELFGGMQYLRQLAEGSREGQEQGVSGFREDWAWLKGSLGAVGQAPRKPSELIWKYGDRIREVLGTGLVYMIAHDRSRSSFAPLGINSTENFAKKYAMDRLKIASEVAERHSWKGVVEKSMFFDLLPNRQGLSWEIIEGFHPNGILEDASGITKSRARPLAKKYCARRICLPLSCRASARPEGALWAWSMIDRKDNQVESETVSSLCFPAGSDEAPASIVERVHRRMAPLNNIIATLYSLMRRDGTWPWEASEIVGS